MSTPPDPSAALSMVAAVLVRELQDGQSIDGVLAVREIELRRTRAGGEYVKLVLGDKTGTVQAVMWDCDSDVVADTPAGCAARVRGRYSVHSRYGPQLVL